jgi:hypothetical protein
MWLPGHVALALLICLPLLWLYRIKKGSYLLALAFVAFFSVLPDFLHFDTGLRTVSHSLMGATVLAAVILVIMWKAFGTGWVLQVIAMVAVYAHLAGDLYIGHIYPYYPFSTAYIQNNQFNTVFDLRFEIVVSSIATFVAIALYAFDRKAFRLAEVPPIDLRGLLTMVLPFAALCLAQIAYFGILDILQNFTWSAIFLGLFFLALLSLSLLWALKIYRAIQNSHQYSSKESNDYPF